MNETDYIRMLGGKQALKNSLKKGGKTIADIMRDLSATKGIMLTRARGHQIVQSIGLTSTGKEREPIWYARRALPENEKLAIRLTTPKDLRRMIKKTGGVVTLADQLKIERHKLVTIVKKTIPSWKRDPAKLFTFSCEQCGKPKAIPAGWAKRDLKLSPHKKWFCSQKCMGIFSRGKRRKKL